MADGRRIGRPVKESRMDWQDLVLVALAVGFLLLWFFVLPRMGLG